MQLLVTCDFKIYFIIDFAMKLYLYFIFASSMNFRNDYVTTIYFFFSPTTPALRDAIQTGLERAYSNGMLLELLKSHPETAPSFNGLDLGNIRIIHGTNENLPEKSRQIMKQYGLFE